MNEKTTDEPRFIVDNSASGWTGAEYLRQWCDISRSFDVATGWFEIGGLLELDERWQQLGKIRILMGSQVTAPTKKALREAVTRRAKAKLDASLEEEKGSNPFLEGTDAIVEALPYKPSAETVEEYDEDDPTIHIAIIGRPNVGKSSLLNRLLGQERAIVSPVAGTTRDAVDTALTWNDIPLTLIDTAGIRRRGRIEPGVEKYSVLRAMKAIERADVSLLLIDATEGVTQQDAHIAGMIQEAMKSAVVVVNKWDLIEKDAHTINEYMEKIRHDLAFMPYVPVLFISAKTGQRIHTVLETAVQVQEERMVRIPTGELNDIVREAMLRHAPATKQPRPLKIFLAQQVRVDPPTFLFHVNDTRLVHFSYERYLENQIRRHYPFTGTPIRLSFRPRDEERVGATARKRR